MGWRDAEGTGVGRRREYEAAAETGHDERPEQGRRVTRVHADPGEPGHAGRVAQQAEDDQGFGPNRGISTMLPTFAMTVTGSYGLF